MSNKLNSYELSRAWFDWCFENPEKITPNHSALYFFCIEHCNRLGWKEKFGLPTTMAKEAIGIKSYNTYIKTLNSLVDWGFINLIQKSTNQYSANIIALSNINKPLNKALDKALIKHGSKQRESISSIDKQENKEQNNNIEFNVFWDLYNKKVGSKDDCNKKWNKLKDSEREKVINTLPSFLSKIKDKKYQPFPATYLNQKRFNDEGLSKATTHDYSDELLKRAKNLWAMDRIITEGFRKEDLHLIGY
tara:strand:+ start:256 stop:999 length:744 start_codon:yes stop_codon:yes gene_type:complete